MKKSLNDSAIRWCLAQIIYSGELNTFLVQLFHDHLLKNSNLLKARHGELLQETITFYSHEIIYRYSSTNEEKYSPPPGLQMKYEKFTWLDGVA